MKILKLATLLLAVLFLNSCSVDDMPKLPKGDYEKGYFVTNEGPFQNGSGTITFVGDDAIISQNIYKTVNNEDLGNIVNSMSLSDENAYIIVNNSNKIVVANRYTMEKIAVIEGASINQPRYMAISGDTGYVSNWGNPLSATDDFITVIDLKTNLVINTISVGEGPENMQVVNSNLYVTLQGGWSQNNQVVVINTNSNSIEATITVGDIPNSIIEDASGDLWVLCGGKPSWTGSETAGALYKINTNNFSALSFEFELAEHPEHLANDANNLYYNLNGKVYEKDATSNSLPTESITGFDGYYYTMKVNSGKLFTTDAKDYASEGSLNVFDLTSGTLLETITTGIIPGDIIFQ